MTPTLRLSILAFAAALALALAFGVSEARAPSWHVERVGPIGQRDGYYNDVAVTGNQRGRRLIAWTDYQGMHVATSDPEEHFGRPRLVRREKTNTTLPLLAMNARGDALLVWYFFDRTHISDEESRADYDCCFGARMAVLHRDGRIGRITTLAHRAVDVYVQALAIDSSGRYGVVWREPDAYYQQHRGVVGQFHDGHRLRPTQKVDRHVRALEMAYVHGRPRVLLLAHHDGRGQLVERTAHHNGRFGARRPVAKRLPPDPIIDAVSNERGDQAVAWMPEEYAREMYGGTRAAGGRLRPRLVARTQQQAPGPLAIAPSGAAALAWSPDRSGVLLARSPGRGAPFGKPRRVVRPRRDGYDVDSQIAIDSAGHTALAWRLDRGLRTAVVDPDGRRHDVRTFTWDAYALARSGTGVIDAGGRATLAWLGSRYVRVAEIGVDR